MASERVDEPAARSSAGSSSRPSVELELAQLRPAGVGIAFVDVARAGVVEVLAADRAEARAVGPAEDLLAAQREDERVAGPRAQVEHLPFDVGALELLSPTRLVHLAGVYDQLGHGRLEASHARPGERRGEAHAHGQTATGHARDVERHVRPRGLDRVGLVGEAEALDGHLELEPAPLAGAERQPAEVEAVG